ncbi:hypothetical protein Tco_0266986 [Tanacetum coccineum]
MKVSTPKSFASLVTNEAVTSKVNFRSLDSDKPINSKAEVKIPKASILDVHSRFGFSVYGYFRGKIVAFPVVEFYVKNAWKKFGLVQHLDEFLEDIQVTWAHLEKKRTRLQLYTKSLEEYAYNAWRRHHILL